MQHGRGHERDVDGEHVRHRHVDQRCIEAPEPRSARDRRSVAPSACLEQERDQFVDGRMCAACHCASEQSSTPRRGHARARRDSTEPGRTQDKRTAAVTWLVMG